MSTRKDKFSKKDGKYMDLALTLASARHGLTGENPSVGCIIVKNDEIISIGQTGFNGRPHAEYNAIKNSNETLVIKESKALENISKHIGKLTIVKNIYIKNKLVNFISKK